MRHIGRYVCSICRRGGDHHWWQTHLDGRRALAAPHKPSRNTPCPPEDAA